MPVLKKATHLASGPRVESYRIWYALLVSRLNYEVRIKQSQDIKYLFKVLSGQCSQMFQNPQR